VIDITPHLPRLTAEQMEADPPFPIPLMAGPRRFNSFAAMLETVHATMPHRTRESLIPGLRHNAKQLDDGGWRWRYDELLKDGDPPPDHGRLWSDVESLRIPTMFVKGGRSPMMTDDAVRELRRRLPSAQIEVVAEAGHAVQNDMPVELARLVDKFLATLARV
jgi:pimeloyl-ACP methyl ester carboxylesterase